ncbi:L-type lectin-like domain-containing protein C4F6,05c [Talaromyces islandicus]|uniref:L-type lectin-like domain-containing protein C4F6,05c n=1 Tax=Talaromyces islandicus TaxID=28573 RepID=A0A0U1LL60_TALIS|nr:L-type lectin-like domain-containing protein C4F6,05c [Talaromyces islandicus]
MKLSASLALYLTAVSAQSVIESVSFGYGNRISENAGSIPGWTVKGEAHQPQILSNKVILTPPDPGNTRGSLWAENALSETSWNAEFQFRASGPERGSGNLQVWYVKDGESNIGSSSIYTVGKFDGFVLTIDTHGGGSGSVRGFLNDGSIAYNSHANVDSLAFGHCAYPYRNLGRPSVVEIKQSGAIFEVIVDQKLCFQTPKVALPSGYKFGITAATPDTPDSFEVFKFAVTPGPQTVSPPSGQSQQQVPVQRREQPIDSGALNDINSRLGQLSQEISQLSQKSEARHQELLSKAASGSSGSSSPPSSSGPDLSQLSDRLQRIENALSKLQRDVDSRDYRNQFSQLHKAIETSHVSLTEALLNMITAATPRMGLFICVVIVFQLILAGTYILYKRRRNSMPKKFL